MTSPFGGQSSDLPSLPTGAQAGGVGTTTSPVTAPSPLTALLPHIASSTSGLGLTPGSNPFLALQPGANTGAGGNGTIMTPGGSLSLGAGSGSGSGAGAGIGVMGAPSPFPLTFPLPPNASLPTAPISQGQITAGLGGGGGGSGSIRSANGSGNTSGREVSLDQTIRGLDEGLGMLKRAMEIGRTLQAARDGVFGSEEGAGIGSGVGSIGNLQLEYSQIINSLYLLSQSSQFGAIPLVPSPQTTPATTTTTTQELTEWCETRSALEFGRREGVKGGSKVVLDILGA